MSPGPESHGIARASGAENYPVPAFHIIYKTGKERFMKCEMVSKHDII